MRPELRDYHVRSIVAGVSRLKFYWDGSPRAFFLWPLTRAQALEVELTFLDALEDAESAELMTEDEAVFQLAEEGLWGEAKEKELEDFQKNVEKIKIGMYENRFEADVLKASRRALHKTKERIGELFLQKHASGLMTCTGYAKAARLKHRVALALRDEAGQAVFPGAQWLSDEGGLLDRAVSEWQDAQLTEADFRELARTTPWRPVWQSRASAESVFGIPCVDYTEDQHNLVAASQLYEQIRQHPECPSDYVLEDDDLLDGWLLIQHKKGDAADNERDIESTIRSEKIKGAQEVFKVVGKNKGLAEKVAAMNSQGAQKVIERRFGAIEKKGKVAVQDLPDMKQNINMQREHMRDAKTANKK